MKKKKMYLGVVLLLLAIFPASALSLTIGGVDYFQSGTTETVMAIFNTPDGGVSTNSYAGLVEIEISGVGQVVVPNYWADAFYGYAGLGGHSDDWWQLAVNTSTLNGSSWKAKDQITYDIDAGLDVSGTYLPSYRGDHNYHFVIDLGTRVGNLHFGIMDYYYVNNGSQQFTIAVNQLEPVPEPATMFLLGSGLVGLAGFRRKKKK